MDPAAEQSLPTNQDSSPAERPKPSPEQVARAVLDERQVRVFRPSIVRFDPRKVQLPDDFFQPSISELVSATRQFSTRVQNMGDAPLMTKKMRDAEAAKRMSRFRKVLIRILFPDRLALQGIFTPQTTVRQVVRFVRAALLDARNVKFHLFVVPPKMKLTNMEKTLWSEGFAPAALIHIAIDEGPTETSKLLKPYLMDMIEDTPETPNSVPTIPTAPPVRKETSSEPSESKPSKKGIAKKIPKWFKK